VEPAELPSLGPPLRDHLHGLLRSGAPALERAIADDAADSTADPDPDSDEPPVGRWVTFVDRPAGRALLDRSRDELVAVAVATLHRSLDRLAQREAGTLDIAIVHEDVLLELVMERLAGRKLPYGPLDAAVAVRLATAVLWRDEVRLALNAATVALDAEPGQPDVVAALEDLDAALDAADPLRRGKMADWRPKVRALLGTTDPRMHLATVLGRDDEYAAPALERVLAETGWDAAAFLAELASPRGAQPPARWWPSVERWLTGEPQAADLVVDLLRLATEVPVTVTTKERHGVYAPPMILFDETDTAVVRGLAWAARDTGDGVVPILGHLALRSAAVVDGWWAADPICSKVALAAIDTLGSIDSDAARAELDALFDEMTLAKLVRRVAAARGRTETEVKARLAEIRKGGRRPRVTPPAPDR
jgi:hypothetical protein